MSGQRVQEGQRTGYAGRYLDRRSARITDIGEAREARKSPTRPRNFAHPRRSQHAPKRTNLPYPVRVRNTAETWAGLVKGMREATGMSGNELARRLQVDRATIWRWESGRQKPDNPNIVKGLRRDLRTRP